MAAHESGSNWQSSLPATPVQRWTRPLARFLRMEAASGGVLLVCAAAALCLANSPYAEAYNQFLHAETEIRIGTFRLIEPLEFWINDGLMAIFFFVIGLEVKREIVHGELRDMRKAALPILGAIGGMAAPAVIYYGLQHGQAGVVGWAIPMATDIAFVVGFLALLGPRVPFALRIFLLSLAIADDIGAVLVIAIFYSADISHLALGVAFAGLVVYRLLNVLGVRNVIVHLVVAAGTWFAVWTSGMHPTVAGVLLGLLTPARARIGVGTLTQIVSESLDRLRRNVPAPASSLPDGARDAARTPRQREDDVDFRDTELLLESASASASPLHRLERSFHPWVAFGIMPIFALANAGVAIDMSAVRHPVALAVALGLLIGKPFGIVAVSWLGVKIGLARLPTGVNWKIMCAAGCLGGIGFTMSLFITGLAFEGNNVLLDAGKIGTLGGSTCSAIAGCIIAVVVLPSNKRT